MKQLSYDQVAKAVGLFVLGEDIDDVQFYAGLTPAELRGVLKAIEPEIAQLQPRIHDMVREIRLRKQLVDRKTDQQEKAVTAERGRYRKRIATPKPVLQTRIQNLTRQQFTAALVGDPAPGRSALEQSKANPQTERNPHG